MTSVGVGFTTVAADLVGRDGNVIVNPFTNIPILIEITETEFTSGGQSVFQTFNFSNRIENEGLEFEENLEIEEIFGTTLPGGVTGVQFVSLTSLPPFAGTDTLNGGGGDDTTGGGGGDDTTDGGGGGDTTGGGGGDDTTGGGGGDDTTGGGGGDDSLRPNQPPDAVNDQFQTKQGDPVFFNVLENDIDPDGDTLNIGTFTQTQNGTLAFAGAGIFTYEPNREFFGLDGFSYTVTDGTATDLAEVVINVIPQDLPILIEGIGKGTVEDDTITGSSGEDVIDGLEGNDSIFGLAGNDQIQGSEGIDFLFGNTDNDTLEGGTGNDQIYGGKQSDRLVGEDGDDGLFGNLGEDTLLGGQGRDSMYGGQANDSLRGGLDDDLVLGDKDNDVVWGDEGNDSVYGGSGEDLIFGNDGADSLLGDTGNDTIFAGTGSDTGLGGEGNDQISGELGSDFLFGGEGADTLAGGTGSDTFAIAEGTGGSSIEEANIVQDFQPDDFIGLAGGLNFSDLDISQSSENAGDTIIRRGEEGEFLAVLLGVDSGSLSEDKFVSVSLDNLPTPPTPTPIDPPTPTPIDPPTPTPIDPPTPTPIDPPTPTPIDPPTPPPNRPPVANDDAIKRNLDQPVTFNVLTNDTDPDGDVIQITAFSPTTGGELINQGGGVFTYVPEAGFLGTDAFTYTITDTGNRTDTALVTLSVNQPPVLANNQLLVVDLSDPQATTVSRDTLLAVDPDDPPSEVEYIITQGTQRGDLLRLGTQTQALRVGDRFTQENIDNGSIRFDGDGPAGEDGFLFAVTDGIGTLPQALFSIALVDRTLNTIPGKATTGGDLGEAIIGTDVDDSILGGGGRDVIQGLGGNDSLDGGTGNDVIDGGSGDDIQLGQEGNDSLVGGSGNDLLDGGAGINTLQGDDGNDVLIGGNESNILDGGKGNDNLSSGLGSDSLVGGIGDDTMNGNAGEDTIRGDAGQDVIFAGPGRDFVRGGEDDDTILGQDNSDVISGDQGSDSISGDQGDDTLLGDTGISSLSGGSDTISGGVGNDSIFGEKGNDSLIGEQGQDSIFGGDNDDVIFGREDNDLMFGDGGNDTIRAGIGDDTLAGGAGGDLLISDAGNDVFYYLNPFEGVDIINDFDQAGNDQFLIVSGTSNFPGLVPNVGTSTPLQSIIISSLGSEGDDITGRQLIIFQDTFDDVQAVNAQLANQNGSNDSSALIVYRNNLSYSGFSGSYVLAFDPDLSDDSLPAFDLGILSSIDPSTDNISTVIASDDFTII